MLLFCAAQTVMSLFLTSGAVGLQGASAWHTAPPCLLDSSTRVSAEVHVAQEEETVDTMTYCATKDSWTSEYECEP